MAELKQIVRLLERQRRELVEQLAAVDKAIAALVPLKNATVAVGTDAPAASSDIPTEDPPATTLPRRVKPKRVLTDVHKQALMTARRKAREAHEVAKGLAREMPEEGFVPAIGVKGDRQAPRLIKRKI